MMTLKHYIAQIIALETSKMEIDNRIDELKSKAVAEHAPVKQGDLISTRYAGRRFEASRIILVVRHVNGGRFYSDGWAIYFNASGPAINKDGSKHGRLAHQSRQFHVNRDGALDTDRP